MLLVVDPQANITLVRTSMEDNGVAGGSYNASDKFCSRVFTPMNQVLLGGSVTPVIAKSAGYASSKILSNKLYVNKKRGLSLDAKQPRPSGRVTPPTTTTTTTCSSKNNSNIVSTSQRKRTLGQTKPLPLPVQVLNDMFSESETGRQQLVQASQVVFPKPSQESIDAYDIEVANAIRKCDVPELRAMYRDGKSFNACNKFGESLIHMACRRGHVGVLTFLIEEADVPLNARDDFGRTPLHDACWTPKPNFDVMDLLLKHAPAHTLLAEDVRGHTPFNYTRKEHWDAWAQYVRDRRHLLIPTATAAVNDNATTTMMTTSMSIVG